MVTRSHGAGVGDAVDVGDAAGEVAVTIAATGDGDTASCAGELQAERRKKTRPDVMREIDEVKDMLIVTTHSCSRALRKPSSRARMQPVESRLNDSGAAVLKSRHRLANAIPMPVFVWEVSRPITKYQLSITNCQLSIEHWRTHGTQTA